MSKFLAIGMSLPQVIACVTANAADSLNLKPKVVFSLVWMPT